MVSARFSGLDGVSLEARKVADALSHDGHEFVWFAGELADEFTPGAVVANAGFETPENLRLSDVCFGSESVGPDIPDLIRSEADAILHGLERFVDEHSVEALMVQNSFAIPMQLPLGVALTDLIEESDIQTIAHHHDFAWERSRYSTCGVPSILDRSFPPVLEGLSHVVINSRAGRDLAMRKGVESTLLPNVMDFDDEPETGDASRYRELAGLSDEDTVFLQPTRVIPRKGIERTIELARRLGDPKIKVVVSHPDDLDEAYWARLNRLAERVGVDLRLAAAGTSGLDLADSYAAADLVCFPSLCEGFGNALLEAVYYRRPVLVNRYPVYDEDIAPTGIDCVEIDGAVSDEAVERVSGLLSGDSKSMPAVDLNYQLGRDRFSYQVVRNRIGPLLDS